MDHSGNVLSPRGAHEAVRGSEQGWGEVRQMQRTWFEHSNVLWNIGVKDMRQ